MKAIKASKIKTQKLTVLDIDIEKPFSAKDIFMQLKNEILDGHTDIFKSYLFLHQVNNILEMFKKDKDLSTALENVVLRFDKTAQYGFTAKVVNRKLYDFSACNDEYLNVLNSELKSLKEAIKDREEFLKHHENDEKRPTFKYTTFIQVEKAA